jgi:hypothetical protein
MEESTMYISEDLVHGKGFKFLVLDLNSFPSLIYNHIFLVGEVVKDEKVIREWEVWVYS